MNATDASGRVTLRQAVLWIGLGRKPRDRRLEHLDGEDHPIADRTVLAKLPLDQQDSIGTARKDLTSALIEGKLAAMGRPLVFELQVLIESYRYNWSVWEALKVVAPRRPQAEIPATFWDPASIAWDDDWAANPKRMMPGHVAAYVEVWLRHADVERLWPIADRPKQLRKLSVRGRRPVHDPAAFFHLLAWEAHANSLPDKQADLVRRMSELLLLRWGEKDMPGDSWVKEQIGALYKARAAYERARVELDGKVR